MPNVKIVSDTKFREALKSNNTDGLGLRKGFTCDIVRAIDVERRIVDFVISTDAVDRMGDTVSVEGWDLKAYKKNPVVLFGHDHRSPPIAKSLSVEVTDTGKNKSRLALVSRAEFMSQDISPFAFSIFQMYVEGFMKATSVGFIPKEFEFAADQDKRPFGIDFHKQELIEYSAVPVPANPEALVDARSKGIDTLPMVKWAEQVLDEYEAHEGSGLVLPRKTVEQLRKHADPRSRKVFKISQDMQRQLARENLKRIEAQVEELEMRESELNKEKTVITWNAAHPNGTAKAPASEVWLGHGNSISADDLLVMAAFRNDKPRDALTLDDFKCVHHKADHNHTVVFDAVVMCAATLPLLSVSDEELRGIQSHLGDHYSEYDETAPWEANSEVWDQYVAAVRAGDAGEISSVFSVLFGQVLPETDPLELLGIDEPVDLGTVEDDSAGIETKQNTAEVEGDADVEVGGADIVELEVEDDVVESETDDAGSEDGSGDVDDSDDEFMSDDDEDYDEDFGITELTVEEVAGVLVAFMDDVIDMTEAGLIDFEDLKASHANRRLLRTVADNANTLAKMLEKTFVNDGVATDDEVDIDFSETERDASDDGDDGFVDDDIVKMVDEDLPAIIEATLKEHLRKLTGKVD